MKNYLLFLLFFLVSLLGAKGLAMTTVDVLRDPAFQDEIRRSHKEQVPSCYEDLMHDA